MRLLSANVRFYVVQRRDTLSQIAERGRVKLHDLVKWNKIRNQDLIFPGQLIMMEPF